MQENQPAPAPGGEPPREEGQSVNPTKAGATAPKPGKVKRRRRRWPWIVVGIVVLLLILLLILPTLISSGIGRSIVVSQVNRRIDGKVEIKGLSLGWVTPIRAEGVVVFDATGRQIMQLQRLTTGLTLLNAARGNYAIGKTEIDGLDVLVSREADGSLNWSHLARGGGPAGPEPAPETKPAAREPAKLPNVEGEIVLDHCTITYEDRSDPHQPPVYLRSVQADVKIPSINSTITDTVSIEAQVGSAAPGKITLAGSLDAIKDNRLAMGSATIDQKLTVSGIDAAAISPLLGPNLKLTGTADAGFTLSLKDGRTGSVEASAQLKNASIAQGTGPSATKVIDNDTFTVLAAGTYSVTEAGRDLKLEKLKVGDEQGIVSVQKDPAQNVAVTLPANGNPSAAGKIGLHADLNRLNDIAQAIKGTQVVARDPNGMELKSGLLDGTLTLAQANPGQIGLTGAFEVKQMTVGNATSTPLKNESLQLSVQALANHDLSQVDVPQFQAKSNMVTVDGHDIVLKLANGSDPKAPPVPTMQKLQKASLTVAVPSLAKVLALDEAVSGKPAKRHYDGALALKEQLSTDSAGNLVANGTGELTNLVADGQADPEKAFHLANDLSLNPDAKTLDLRSLNLVATTTNALNLVVKGKVIDLGGQQKIQDALTADLAYDLDPLWKVLFPLLTPEQRKSYADVKVAGKYQKQIVVTGAYPAGEPFSKAVQSIAAYLSLQFDQLYTSGVTLEKGELPVDLKDGVARVQYHGKPAGQNLPPPIACNSGTLNLGGSAIDLRTEHTLLTTPKDLKAMDQVSLNPLFASTFLGKYLNNPLFVNAAEAAGQLSMTIHNCNALAVDDLGSAIGDATIEISIGTLQLGNPDLAKVLPQGFLSSLRGQVPAYRIVIAKGILTQDFTLELLQEKRPLKLTGQVDLKSKQMISTTLEMPWALFALKDPSLQKYLPEGIKIPFMGRSDSPVPALDVNQMMKQSLGQAGQKYLQDQLLGKNKNNPGGNQPQDPLKAIEGLLNKNKDRDNPPSSQPIQSPQQEDPLKGIEDLFKKKKK
jgi:hypothetical protein